MKKKPKRNDTTKGIGAGTGITNWAIEMDESTRNKGKIERLPRQAGAKILGWTLWNARSEKLKGTKIRGN